MTVTYTFAERVMLEASSSPGDGYASATIILEQPEMAAMTLLAKEEKPFSPPKGFGINWKKPVKADADDDARVKVYRAGDGNCLARVTVRGGNVVKVKLANATCVHGGR